MAGSTALYDDSFNLPVKDMIVQALRERFPNLDIRPGSALYQAVAMPLAFGFQPFRDRLNVLRRNQSLRFFQYMLTSELDRLTANFLVQRASAINANGTARVYFAQPGNYTVPLTAVFSTDDGRTFAPSQVVSVTQAQVLLNYEDGLYYVNVPVSATLPGSDGAIPAGTITRVTGVVGAVSATNKTAFFGGRDIESNAGLVARTRRSIATRTLTSRASIEALLREQFGETLISVTPIGFGDEGMTRDVIRSFVSFDDLFTTTYCRKINVSINEAGEVFTGSGQPPANNRYVGAIIDTRNTYTEPDTARINDPYYFWALPVTRSGRLVKLALNRGDKVVVKKVDQSAGPDPDDGTYVVTDIVYAAPYAGHVAGDPAGSERTMMLVLDRPFTNPQPQSINTNVGSPDLVAHEYRISTGVSTEDFHVGGHVDLYVHTANTFNDVLVIAELFPSSVNPSFFDVPIRATQVLNPLNNPWYEDGKVFQLPVITIVKVEQIDLTDASLVLRELSQGKDFVYIDEAPDLRLTPEEQGVLRFIGSSFSGARIRVTYTTNSDVRAIQDFVSLSERRDLTKNILVKAAAALLVDVELAYTGNAEVEDVVDVVKGYVNSRPQGGEITVNQIVSLLNVFDVTDIRMPVTLRAKRFHRDGTVSTLESTDRITASALERFVADDSLSIG